MDVENFKKVFLPLHPKLFRIAYALVENKADAEDILQDAYYKLWSRRNELTDIQNPEAFRVTLVKNLCLDFLRSPRANRRDADVTEAVTLSTASSPDEELERQDKVQQIRHLIDRLPENQRQVLRLRGIEDCSMDEIEQITGLSAVNIRVLLSRARKIIREYYWCDKIALVKKSSNKESSLTFWFELIDESCLVNSVRSSVRSNAEILIKVATSVIE